MSAAARRRQPPRRQGHYDDYAGEPAYAGQPHAGGYEQDYDYDPRNDPRHVGPYDPRYGPPADEDWWEEGTGGMFSPVRVLLGLLVLGAGAVAFYGMFLDRTPLQIPIAVSGLAVLGISLSLLALSSARGAASLGRRGYGGRAVLAAVFGGLCAIGGFGSLAGALVLGMIAASA